VFRRDSEESDGPPRPLKLAARIALQILAVVVIAIVGTLAIRAAGRISGTGRILFAAAMAIAIAVFGIGYFRQLTHPPPPDPAPMEVDPRLRLAYVCEMCGLELAVVMAAKEKPPKHCGEPMVLVRRWEDQGLG
jgi:hypothetical protein